MSKKLDIIRREVEFITYIRDISVKNRKFENVQARWLYYKLAKEFTDESLQKIGSQINKNHATVVHGLKVFEHEILYDKRLQQQYEALNIILLKQFRSESLFKIDQKIDHYRKALQQLENQRVKIIEDATINSK